MLFFSWGRRRRRVAADMICIFHSILRQLCFFRLLAVTGLIGNVCCGYCKINVKTLLLCFLYILINGSLGICLSM